MTMNLSNRGITYNKLRLLWNSSKTSCPAFIIESLQLSYNNLGDCGCDLVASYLMSDNTILTLDMCFNSIGDERIASLSAGLRINKSLRELSLAGNSITARGFGLISQCLLENHSLTYLDLSCNSCEAEGASAIGNVLKGNSTLQTLNLNGTGLRRAGTLLLAEPLAHNQSLINLVLSNNQIDDAGVLELSRALSRNRHLQSLILSFNLVTAVGMEGLCAAMAGYTSLKRMHIDNNMLGDKGALELAKVLPSTNIDDLNVGFNSILQEGLIAIIQSISTLSLRQLVLSGNSIDGDVALALAGYLKGVDSDLRELYLDSCGLGAPSWHILVTAIATNKFSALEVLAGIQLGETLIDSGGGSPRQLDRMSNSAALRSLT